MNLMCEICSFNELKRLSKYNKVKLVVIGTDFLSLNSTKNFNFNEIENIVGYAHVNDIKVCLDVEKLFHEDDLKYINMIFKNPIIAMIDYFMYSDLGFYQLMVEKGWSNRLIYHAPTYMTNTLDVKLYQKLNSFVVISNQITSSELIQISNNVLENYIVDVVGMACCFYSRRPLVSNYFLFKDRKPINYMGKIAKLQEETRTNYYNLIEDENGTRVFEEAHYALTTELDSIKNGSYLFINHFNLRNNIYSELVSLYNDYLSNRIDSNLLDENINKLDVQFYKGAYNNKTVLLKEDAQ